jgi:NAD(P)-dependent dehydrogenase (short-subunit alcohol dehydrogenase family)
MDIRGCSAVVTGGASGLGLATVRALVADGAKVLILDRDEQRADAVREELGDSVAVSVTDVTDREGVHKAVEEVARVAPLRAVVNCAGIGVARRVIDRQGVPHELELFDKVVRVNLIGTFNVMAVGASVISQGQPLADGSRGVIINTASIAAFDGQIGQIAYAASKGGIVGMTLPGARDLAAVGIRVMTIAPGIIDTPLLGQLPEEVRGVLGAGVPFPRRLGLPDDYAQLVRAIIANDYLNGEVIRLDGALRMAPK